MRVMPPTIMIVIIVAVSVLPVFFFVVPLLTGGAKNKRLLKTGTQARAVITNLEQTGTYINNQPRCHIYLQVEPGGGVPPFAAVATRTVQLVQIPQFQPGQILTVRFNPADHSQVAIEAFGHVDVAPDEAQRLVREADELFQALNAPGAGTPASAIVTAFKPTGMMINGPNPLAVLELKVLPSGGAPFDAALTGVFGAAGLHKYQPGQTVYVRYDPARPSRVTFDKSRTAGAISNP